MSSGTKYAYVEYVYILYILISQQLHLSAIVNEFHDLQVCKRASRKLAMLGSFATHIQGPAVAPTSCALTGSSVQRVQYTGTHKTLQVTITCHNKIT
jgi:hypothetical protein